MNKKLLTVLFLSLLLILTGVTTESFAEKLSGKDIMEKVYNRETGEDRTANLKMILVNKFGDEREREIKQFNRKFDEVEKKIMFFTAPSDIRGTSFMNWTYDDDNEDSQWIYLPALGKIKRISSENKSDYFMGSDFTYDDLGERNLNEDTHKLLKTEEIEGESCYVVESTPIEEDDMYSKIITWVSQDKWIELKKEFYDKKDNHLKTLTVIEYEEIDGIYTVTHSKMNNVQKEHKTVLKLNEVEYDKGISQDRFTERQMKLGF
jgi:hypothetical protein